MSSVLFVTWDGGGNLPPALGIANELRAAGSSVRFLGHEAQRGSVEAARFDFEAYRNGRDWSGVRGGGGGIRDVLAIFGTFTDRGIGRDLIDSVTARPVDCVVIDCLLTGALAAAQHAELPRIVLVHSLYSYFIGLSRGALRAFGLPKGQSARALWRSADLVIVTALPSLDSAHATEAGEKCRYVGPIVQLGSPVNGPAHETKRVLLSVSTVGQQGQERFLQEACAAIDGLGMRGVLTTGPAVDRAEVHTPPSIEVHPFLPHAEVMPDVDLVVSHGGHGTAMQALAHDRPLVLAPMHPMIDQPLIARVLGQRGAAVTVKKTASADEIATAIARVASERSFADAAARLGAEIRSMASARLAAEAITGLG